MIALGLMSLIKNVSKIVPMLVRSNVFFEQNGCVRTYRFSQPGIIFLTDI